MDCASGFGAATMVTASFGFVAVSHALKKDDGEGGTSGLSLTGGIQYRVAERDQPLTARGAELRAQPKLIK